MRKYRSHKWYVKWMCLGDGKISGYWSFAFYVSLIWLNCLSSHFYSIAYSHWNDA